MRSCPSGRRGPGPRGNVPPGGFSLLSHGPPETFAWFDNKYDEKFGPEIEAVVYEKASGKRAVIPAKGFKGHKDIV